MIESDDTFYFAYHGHRNILVLDAEFEVFILDFILLDVKIFSENDIKISLYLRNT